MACRQTLQPYSCDQWGEQFSKGALVGRRALSPIIINDTLYKEIATIITSMKFKNCEAKFEITLHSLDVFFSYKADCMTWSSFQVSVIKLKLKYNH